MPRKEKNNKSIRENVTVKQLTLLLHISEVLSSNFGLKTGYFSCVLHDTQSQPVVQGNRGYLYPSNTKHLLTDCIYPNLLSTDSMNIISVCV